MWFLILFVSFPDHFTGTRKFIAKPCQFMNWVFSKILILYFLLYTPNHSCRKNAIMNLRIKLLLLSHIPLWLIRHIIIMTDRQALYELLGILIHCQLVLFQWLVGHPFDLFCLMQIENVIGVMLEPPANFSLFWWLVHCENGWKFCILNNLFSFLERERERGRKWPVFLA